MNDSVERTPGRTRVMDVACVAGLLALTMVAMTLLYAQPIACTAMIALCALLSVHRFRTVPDLRAGLVGCVCGPLAEWAATGAGLWRYSHPQIHGLPLWTLPMWWLFPVCTRRLALAFGGEPRESFFLRPLLVMGLEILWLCWWGNASPGLALLGILILGGLCFGRSWSRADTVALVCCGCVGPFAEFIPIRAGAFHYVRGDLFGMPIWLAPGYALFGIGLLRFAAALSSRARWK